VLTARIKASDGLDARAKEQLFAEATSELFSEAFRPVSAAPWTMASFLAFSLLAFAVIAGTYWAVSRTGLWQAGVCVAAVAALAWILVVAVGWVRLHSMAEVLKILTDASAAVMSRRRVSSGLSNRVAMMILSDPRLEWSIPVKAALLVAGPAWAGTQAGMKGWAARLNRDHYRPATLEDAQLLRGSDSGALDAAPAVAAPVVQSKRAASWDPLAATPVVEPAIGLGVVAAAPTVTQAAPQVAPQFVGAVAAPGAGGLCPQCGAVNGPANRQCVMCSTELG
jgi:hypothetical protein